MQTGEDQDEDEISYILATQAPILKVAEKRQNRILDANYVTIDLDEKVNVMNSLSEHQKKQLIKTLKTFSALISAGLGAIDIEPIHLEVNEGTKSKHFRSHQVPETFENPKKKDCVGLCRIGVVEEASHSQWVALTFVRPKKTRDEWVLTTICELNKVLIQKSHPLPKIQDLSQKMEKFKYTTVLDLSMGYYHIPLDEYSQNLCTTILAGGGDSSTRNFQWESPLYLTSLKK